MAEKKLPEGNGGRGGSAVELQNVLTNRSKRTKKMMDEMFSNQRDIDHAKSQCKYGDCKKH